MAKLLPPPDALSPHFSILTPVSARSSLTHQTQEVAMIPAKNNIIVQIQDSAPAEYAIMNPITGSFDLMGAREHAWFTAAGARPKLDPDTLDYFLERGYAYLDSQGEQQAIERAYAEFSAEVEDGQVQLMLVPTYGCNLACTYCFQHGIDGRPQLITKEIVDAFFAYA
ncbi:MAG: hypothetical protein EOM70_06320, partial [Clostridia bacterium]|nr:hypothetical protein [Clostridia bacterium]